MFKIPYINIEIPKIAFKTQSNKFMHNYGKNLYYNFDKVVFNYRIKDFIDEFKKEKSENFNLSIKKSEKLSKKILWFIKKFRRSR